VDKASILSECEPGARAFWQAVPSKGLDLAVEAAEFVTELQSRLCIDECSSDRWCPLCDAILDTKGHHSKMCCAGGDRTRRHNSLRGVVRRAAARGGLNPELEKPGLLLPLRPEETTQGADRRRPADVYLPAWTGGLPAALDFAVTAPQRQETLAQAATTPLAAASDYDQKKRTFLDTERVCLSLGVTFVPMVVETSGAWSAEASAVLFLIAKSISVRTGRTTKEELQQLLQQAAVCVRRANARAALRRRSG
jgi:hypothetical protein